jgi:hypothetical protein
VPKLAKVSKIKTLRTEIRVKNFSTNCHSGLDLACPAPDAGESSLFDLDSRFRGNDNYQITLKKC